MKFYLYNKSDLFKKIFFCLFLLIFFFQAAESRCETFEADYVPWSGYWWPTIHGGLVTGWDYHGHPAPFEKYDYVTIGKYEGTATLYGREHHYDTDALLWEGLCFCWSVASILEEEPIHKGIYKGMLFRVGDKKGLLTALYYGALVNTYSTADPIEFHQILEEFIAHQKTPVIMDLGTGGESWNYPVFKYETSYIQEGNIRHYTTKIYYVGDDVTPDFIGSQINARVFYYYFILDQDGNISENGWEKETIPPVVAYEPFGRELLNTGLDYEKVKEIVNTNDDEYEENDTVETAASVFNGKYTLLAFNSDYFKIELREKNKAIIQINSEEKEDIWVRTYTPEGELIQETKGDKELIFAAGEDEEYPPGTYFFEIAPINPSKEPVYEVSLQYYLAYQGIYPIYPSGLWQNGIAVLSPDKALSDRMLISLMDGDGSPLSNFSDKLFRQHLLGMTVEDFNLPVGDSHGYIRIDSDTPFCGLQTATVPDFDLMLGSNFTSAANASDSLFFPHFATTGGWQTSFGIINAGDQPEKIIFQSYDQSGQPLASDTIELNVGEKLEKEASSYYTVLTPNARTMQAATESGRESLIGYIIYLNPTIGFKGRAIVPLDKQNGTEFVVPHIAADSSWWTGIALMNTGEQDAIITFYGYDANGYTIDSSEHTLKPKQNFVQMASDIFDTPVRNMASMRIVSENNQPLCGLLIYGTVNELQLASVPLHPVKTTALYLPHIACFEPWWTGIGVMNAGDKTADISFTLFEENSEILGVETKRLNPNQKFAGTVNGLFGDNFSPAARYIKIESDNGQPISGMYLIGTTDGKRLMGDEMQPIH